jgi:hypothetical protein
MNNPVDSGTSLHGIPQRAVLRGTRTAATFVVVILIAACGGGDGGHLQEPVPVIFESMQEAFSGSYPRGEYVLRTQTELEAAWRLAPQQFGQPMPMPVWISHGIPSWVYRWGWACAAMSRSLPVSRPRATHSWFTTRPTKAQV